MAMGDRGMAEMGEMELPLPHNARPMMTGQGPMGAPEMGGTFSVLKVRQGLGTDDDRHPSWYRHIPGSVACEWTGESMNP